MLVGLSEAGMVVGGKLDVCASWQSCHCEPLSWSWHDMLSSPRFPHPPTQRLTQNTSESKNKRPSAADGNVSQDSHCDIVPLTSSYRLQSSFPHPAGETQSAVLFLQSSTTAKDEGQQHISVIHATGSAAKSSPLVGVQSHREVPPLPSGSSPKLIFSTSPTHLSHSSPPKPNSVCPSPKRLAVICPSKPISLSSSPMPFSISSLTKPLTPFASPNPEHKPKLLTASPNHIEIADVMVENSTGPPDGRPLHLNSFLTQVSFMLLKNDCNHAKMFFSSSLWWKEHSFLFTVHNCSCPEINNNLWVPSRHQKMIAGTLLCGLLLCLHLSDHYMTRSDNPFCSTGNSS